MGRAREPGRGGHDVHRAQLQLVVPRRQHPRQGAGLPAVGRRVPGVHRASATRSRPPATKGSPSRRLVSDRQPTFDFDLFGPVNAGRVRRHRGREPREQCPVAWSDRHGGFWVISGYDEVAAAFRDWEHFSSARTDPGDQLDRAGQQPAAVADAGGDRSARLVPGAARSSPSCSRRVPPSELRPRARHWTTHFVDQFIEAGECEFTHELSVPVPGAVTLEWLGFPRVRLAHDHRRVPRRRRVLPRHARAPRRAGAVRQRDGAHPRGGRAASSNRRATTR